MIRYDQDPIIFLINNKVCGAYGCGGAGMVRVLS